MVQDRGHDEGAQEKDSLFAAPTAREVMDALDILRRAAERVGIHFQFLNSSSEGGRRFYPCSERALQSRIALG